MKVCKEQFPKTNGFYMDGYLVGNLEPIIKQINKDWDFVILISGSGMVRVGKSVFALQNGYYLTDQINKKLKINNTFTNWNVCFTGKELIKKGLQSKPYTVLVYDEAGIDLIGRKVMFNELTQNLLNFFVECGQLNLIIIVVIPEYFDLPKSLAVNRSICLLDVHWQGKLERGFFKFYSWKKKKLLYLKGKRELNYSCVKSDFYGRFTNFYTTDEKEYRKLKKEALKQLRIKKIEGSSHTLIRVRGQRNAFIRVLFKLGYNYNVIANKHAEYCDIPLSAVHIGRIMAKHNR